MKRLLTTPVLVLSMGMSVAAVNAESNWYGDGRNNGLSIQLANENTYVPGNWFGDSKVCIAAMSDIYHWRDGAYGGGRLTNEQLERINDIAAELSRIGMRHSEIALDKLRGRTSGEHEETDTIPCRQIVKNAVDLINQNRE